MAWWQRALGRLKLQPRPPDSHHIGMLVDIPTYYWRSSFDMKLQFFLIPLVGCGVHTGATRHVGH
jgi:hypothetical protein